MKRTEKHLVACECDRCECLRYAAQRHFDAGDDLHVVPEEVRPFVLAIRGSKQLHYRDGLGGGGLPIVSEDDPSPWEENAIREYEEVRSV